MCVLDQPQNVRHHRLSSFPGSGLTLTAIVSPPPDAFDTFDSYSRSLPEKQLRTPPFVDTTAASELPQWTETRKTKVANEV